MFWAGVKNLQTDKLQAICCDELFVMEQQDTFCVKFEPKTVGDFNPEQHYGFIQDKHMVLVHIRALDVSKESILDRINTARHPQQIRGKKRLSSSQPLIELSKLVNGKEVAESMKKSEVKKLKTQSSKVSETVVLEKFMKNKAVNSKRKNAKGIIQSKKPRLEGAESTDKEEILKNQSQLTEKKEVIASNHNAQNVAGKYVIIDSQNIKQEDGLSSTGKKDKAGDTALVINEGSDDSDIEVVTGLNDLPACTGNCSMVRFLQQQLQNITEGLAKSGPVDGKKVKESDKNGKGHNKTLNEKFGFPCEQELHEEQIHIGDSIIINFNEVTDTVECGTFDGRARVAKLLEMCFPKDYKLRTLHPEGMKDSKREWLPISKANIRSMTKLLNHFVERDGSTEKYEEKSVREYISKVSKYNRDRMDFDGLEETQKKTLMEERKQKAKIQREKKKEERAQKKKEEKAEKKKLDKQRREENEKERKEKAKKATSSSEGEETDEKQKKGSSDSESSNDD